MSKKLDNNAWEEYINKFDSYNSSVTIKDFCVENNLTRSQFYYHKRRLEKANSKTAIFHEVSLKTDKDSIELGTKESKEVKITIGNATISIPSSETTIILSIIKDLSTQC